MEFLVRGYSRTYFTFSQLHRHSLQQASATFIMSLMRETSGTIVLERKAKRLRAETGNDKLVSKLHSGLTPSELFRFSIVRPVKMFFRSPICFLISTYIAITYSYLYILFTTFTAVFTNTYGWKGGIVGLSFTGYVSTA
jgi:hypothetical protein